jgi:hypothetical protein
VDVKSILHLYPGMKPINVNCSPRVSVDCTKEGKHFLLIKVHTINILLIDFHFIKSKSSMLFLHYDHLNFMLETRHVLTRKGLISTARAILMLLGLLCLKCMIFFNK